VMRRHPDPLLGARLDTNLAVADHHLGDFAPALRRFRRARRVFDQHDLRQDAALVDYGLGQTLLSMGRTAEARVCLEAAERSFTGSGFRLSQLQAGFALACVRLAEGNLDEGFGALEEIRSGLEALRDDRSVLAVRWEISRYAGVLGALEIAEAEARAAWQSAQRLGLSRDAAQIGLLHARWLRGMGRLSDARVQLRRAAEHWLAVGDRASWHRTQLELAGILLRRDQPREAAAMLRGSRGVLARLDRSTAVRAGLLDARIDLAEGRYSRALTRARSEWRRAGASAARWERPSVALVCSQAALESGRTQLALDWAGRAVASVAEVDGIPRNRTLRRWITRRREEITRGAVDVVLRSGHPRREQHALDLITRAHSVEMVEDILSGPTRLPTALRAEIVDLRLRLLRAAEDPGDDVRGLAVADRLGALDRRLRRLQRRPGLPRTVARRMRVGEWSRELGSAALVLLERERGGWAAYCVGPAPSRRVRRVRLPDLEDALSSSWVPLQLLLDTAAVMPPTRRRSFLESTLTEATSALEDLAEAIWRPLQVDERRVCLVVPPQLESIPFEAMAASEDRLVTRAPHPALCGPTVRSSRRRGLLLHGDTPGARAETRSIGARMRRHGWKVRVRGSLPAQSPPVSVLHVAAHGTHAVDHWIQTGVALADGWVGLEALDSLPLPGALVYLATCASGRTHDHAEGRFAGWVTAGLQAEAAEMVLSLWNIDDASARAFAREFYGEWLEGTPAVEAAAAARLRLRRRDPHPYSWASFMVVG